MVQTSLLVLLYSYRETEFKLSNFKTHSPEPWNSQVPTTSFYMREMATDHVCTAFCRFVLFSLLIHQAQAAAVVHMALEQIFQRNRTWGHSTTAPSSPALQGQGMKKTLMPLQPSASHSSILIQLMNFDYGWDSLRVKLQLLSQSWFALGRTQANPQHQHISTERWKWPSQAQNSTTISRNCAVLPWPSWSHISST